MKKVNNANTPLFIEIKREECSKIEDKVIAYLNLEGKFVNKDKYLFYFYYRSEKTYRVGSKDFENILYEMFDLCGYPSPKKIKVKYTNKSKKTKLFISLL